MVSFRTLLDQFLYLFQINCMNHVLSVEKAIVKLYIANDNYVTDITNDSLACLFIHVTKCHD
jgi:hypothetical protein